MATYFEVIDTTATGDTFYEGMVKDAANWAIAESYIAFLSGLFWLIEATGGGIPVYLQVVARTTDCTTGDGKMYFTVLPELDGANLIAVPELAWATCTTAGTTGTMDIQIYNVTQACDMLSTKITIDSTELTSATAEVPAVVDTDHDGITVGDVLRIDIDAVHTTPAKGLFVLMGFVHP